MLHESVPENAGALLQKARHYIEFGETHAAVDSLQRAVEIDADFGDAWHLLATVLQQIGDADHARQCFKKAASLLSDRPEIWLQLGTLEFSQERYRDARAALKRYASLGGSDSDALLMLAKAAFRLADCDTVLLATAEVLKADENQYEAWELRGICQARKGRYNAAVMSLNMALELHPSSVYALNTVGDLCYEEENYERALDFYRSSLAAQWDQPRILFRVATSLWMIGRWQAAIPLFEEYVQLEPEDPRGWNNLGVALREKGEVKRAIECYQHALELDPDFEIAQRNIETAKNKQVAL